MFHNAPPIPFPHCNSIREADHSIILSNTIFPKSQQVKKDTDQLNVVGSQERSATNTAHWSKALNARDARMKPHWVWGLSTPCSLSSLCILFQSCILWVPSWHFSFNVFNFWDWNQDLTILGMGSYYIPSSRYTAFYRPWAFAHSLTVQWLLLLLDKDHSLLEPETTPSRSLFFQMWPWSLSYLSFSDGSTPGLF